MYAKHIYRRLALGDLVATVVQKHVSLRIRREHYPIVGGCLLKSIREVLGPDIATDAVIDAWGAAYGQLANILASAEEAAYDSTASSSGGWRDAREFQVAAKTPESAEITSFLLKPADGKAVLAHQPGQYIGLRQRIGGEDVSRN